MARDFRHGPARRRTYLRKSQQEAKSARNIIEDIPRSLQVGIVVVLVIAAFAAGSLFNKQPNQTNVAVVEDIAEILEEVAPIKEEAIASSATSEEETQEEQVEEEEQINFTFYTDLSQEKLKIDVTPLPVHLDKPLWVQAASTLSEAGALQEQKRLTSDEMKIQIATGVTKSGAKAYRLVTGPFTDKRDLNRALNLLANKGSRGFAIPDPFKKSEQEN